MAINTKKYIEQFLQIRTKSAEVVPLRLNAPQQSCMPRWRRRPCGEASARHCSEGAADGLFHADRGNDIQADGDAEKRAQRY